MAVSHYDATPLTGDNSVHHLRRRNPLRGIPKVADTRAAFSREGVDAPGTGLRRKRGGRLRSGDLQLRLALSRRRVLVSIQAKGSGIKQSGNVDASWCRCGTRAIDLQESPVTLLR